MIDTDEQLKLTTIFCSHAIGKMHLALTSTVVLLQFRS